jgi:hypothetical protein
MKIDIEGDEEKALSLALPLFQKAFFPYIMMEWFRHSKKMAFVHMMVGYGYYAVSHRVV